MDEAHRSRFARASWVNVLGNAVKIIVEGVAGLAFGSVALLADAAHSIADLVASVVVLIWGQAQFKDPDSTHPHGHSRIEPLTALFVGVAITLLGLNLLYESIQGLLADEFIEFSYLLLGAIGFAIVDMYAVYWYTEQVNADLGSTALSALAKDCLNDIYTSIAVIAGVLGVLVGYPILDPLAGGLVSLLVVYQEFSIGRENITYLVGGAPSDEQRTAVQQTLLSHPDVEGIHDLVVFYDGTVLEVEVHAEVDGELSLRDAHEVETELVDMLRAEEGVGDAHVHLDPSGVGEWKEASEWTL